MENKSKNNNKQIVEKIFENEYKPQIKNRLVKELQEMQSRLSGDLLPWIEERFKDIHVQRHFHKEDETEREIIARDLRKKAMNLLMDVISISKIEKL